MAEYKFLISWCNEGLEGIFEYTQDEKDTVWAALQSDTKFTPKTATTLHRMKLRARFNQHREYEIYSLTTLDITEEDIRTMFEDQPQFIVDLIRERGRKIHDDRIPKGRKIIK